MVFYFSTRSESGGELTIFMGLDKHENEDLIKYGFPEDIWFHVDKMSSAHVYLRLRKVNNIDVVYTPWSNLKRRLLWMLGKLVRTVRVEKRNNDIVNRLNKTKVERKKRLKREAVDAAERTEKKHQQRDKKRHEDLERLEKEKQAELRSYKGLMVSENMTSNKQIASGNKSMQELEEDFM
ncbi:hypothetical protein MKW92_052489 [Papaver armeniacum]|nr:hypothetical protein MKW92_052489 [Papaver armeniacum]